MYCTVFSGEWDDVQVETLQFNRLAERARSGDADALAGIVLELLPQIHRKAAALARGGVEADDLAQEGAIGLLRAADRFSPAYGVPFASFALICAERQMRSALRRVRQSSRTPAEPPLSIDDLAQELPSGSPMENPEERLLVQERLRAVFRTAEERLTPLEKRVLADFLKSASYRETADRLGLSQKSVDNAMQRIRRKLRGSSG